MFMGVLTYILLLSQSDTEFTYSFIYSLARWGITMYVLGCCGANEAKVNGKCLHCPVTACVLRGRRYSEFG